MSQIQLKAEDLYDKEKVDLETIVVEDVFKLLQCDENGLTNDEAARRLELFGPNRLESEEQNAFLQVRFHLFLVYESIYEFMPVVLEFHVEPPFLGYGRCCACRYRPVKR